MPLPVLHYIFDPLCGWCYAAAPLLAEARDITALQVKLHGGGLLSGPARRQVTAELRQYVMEHDKKIAKLSGQPFGDAYFNDLLCNEDVVLDSILPITAILATEACGKSGSDMLTALQRAHYVEGRIICELACLQELGNKLDIDATQFIVELNHQFQYFVNKHIMDSRQLMRKVGGNGFPTVALQTQSGFTRLDIGSYFGRPDQWRALLQSQLPG